MTARYEALRRQALLDDAGSRSASRMHLLAQRGLPAWLAALPPASPPALRPRPVGAAVRHASALTLLLSAMVLAQHQEEREEP